MESLVQKLNALCGEQPFPVTWYFKDVRSGFTADRDGEKVVTSASTRKIAILMAALAACHAGSMSLDQPFTVDAEYQNNDSGVFQLLKAGFTITLRDALIMMIVVSDNTCTGKVVDLLGLDAINAYGQRIGMRNSTHRFNFPPLLVPGEAMGETNTTSAADVGRLLEQILQGTTGEAAAERLGVTSRLCQLAIGILLEQRMTNRLPLMLPAEARVAHKTGTSGGNRHSNDVGIIYQGQTPLCVLAIYTGELPRNLPDGISGYHAANLLIAQLARACYDALAS